MRKHGRFDERFERSAEVHFVRILIYSSGSLFCAHVVAVTRVEKLQFLPLVCCPPGVGVLLLPPCLRVRHTACTK